MKKLYFPHQGWSGRYDGWYAYDDWANPNGSYNYFADIIYNIHP